MYHDAYGQPAALSAPEARVAWDATMQAFLAHGAATPEHLARTLGAAPDFALGHAVKGLFLVLLGRRELLASAAEALEMAKNGAGQDARTRAMTGALAECLSGRMVAGVEILSAWLERAPGDALAAKLDHALRFVLGDAAGMRRMLEIVAPSYGADHPAHGYIMGCQAFAFEETGDYGAAERMGRRALGIVSDDAWGLHAVAHVHDMRAEAAEGIEFLDAHRDAWAHCNNFRYHVWWHKALMLLDLERHDAALALYDAEIRADRTDDYRDIANAASLLSRLEIDGVDVGRRWCELADLAENRCEDGCLVFADLHYLMALVADGREEATRRLIARMGIDARTKETDVARRMAAPGLSAATGLEAFGAGDYDAAFLHLGAARRTMQKAGGSHAQRDVFERLCIDAGIRAGALASAEIVLNGRTRSRGGNEDGYAASRHALIEAARRGAHQSAAE